MTKVQQKTFDVLAPALKSFVYVHPSYVKYVISFFSVYVLGIGN